MLRDGSMLNCEVLFLNEKVEILVLIFYNLVIVRFILISFVWFVNCIVYGNRGD